MEAKEAVEHDLGDEDAFEEFEIEAEAAGSAAALERAAAEGIVVFVVSAVAAFGLDAVEPIEDRLEAVPRIVGAAGDEAGHEVMIGEAEDGAAVLDLAAEGDVFRVGPGVVVVVNVAFGSGAGTEFPVVDIGALRGIVSDDTGTLEPLHDGFGLGGRGKTAGDGFAVDKDEAIVVHAVVEIEGGETAGDVVPELRVVDFERMGDAEEIVRNEGGRGWRNAPFRVSGDSMFEGGHFAKCVEEIDRGIDIFAAEGEEIVIIVADAVAVTDVFDAMFVVEDAAGAIVTEPGSEDAMVFADTEFGESECEGGAEAWHDDGEEISIASPRGVGIGGINEDGIIDVMARVNSGTGVSERDDGAGGVVEDEAEAGEGVVGFPARVGEEFEPDVDELLRGVGEWYWDALRLREVFLVVGAEIEEARGVGGNVSEGPLDEEEGGDGAVDGEGREFERGVWLGDADAPAVGEIAMEGEAFTEAEGGDVGSGDGNIREGVRDELPAGAEALSVEGEGPAFGVAEAFVLMAGDVAIGAEAVIEELRADVITLVEAVIFRERGPEEGFGEPVGAEGGAEMSAAEVEEKEFFEEAHVTLVARDDEAREERRKIENHAGGSGRGLRRTRMGGKDSAYGEGGEMVYITHVGIIVKRE